MTQNPSNQQFTNNADGFTIGGGTTARTLTTTGGNVTVTGSGSAVMTLPTTSDTLAGLGTAQTFTATQTFTGAVVMSATSLATDTTTGLKIGTATTQKIAFFNATPVVQQAAATDLGTALSNLGLRASGATFGLTTSGAAAFSGTTTVSGVFTTSASMKFGSSARTATVTLNATTSTQFQLCDATTAAFTITLPTAIGNSGLIFTFKKVDSTANLVTIGTTSSQTIDGSTTYVGLASQYKYVTIYSNNANWLIMGNN